MLDQVPFFTVYVIDYCSEVQLLLGGITQSECRLKTGMTSWHKSSDEGFVLKGGDIQNADVLLTTNNDERKCSLIELRQNKCISLLDIGGFWVIDQHDCAEVLDQIHPVRTASH